MSDVKARLEGLDAARYLAFAGMLLVNFQLAMEVDISASGALNGLFTLLEGKASATFVLLSGIGLSLATRRMSDHEARRWICRRALFLLVAGLLNLTVFPADILHYYAVYFLLAIPLLGRGTTLLIACAVGIALLSCWLLLTHNYSNGWDWALLQYRDAWTPAGFVRNLLFNGFHPVFPWMVFLLTGMALGRLALHQRNVQCALIVAGLALFTLAMLINGSSYFSSWRWLLGTTPMPPGPVYLLTGTGSALTVTGVCLLIARWHLFPSALLSAGRMTLSLYIAHILLGMGALEAMGMLNGNARIETVFNCAAAFLILSTFSAHVWCRYFRQGPVEILMRRV
nr:heparan-alpha-glucosaminide N-acetyltransferase domain-containing protein [uncultured Enterobacter sp.]